MFKHFKIYNIKDVQRFFKLVDSCKGRVYLNSEQGDKFNLKSSLSKYIAFADIFDNPVINDLELEVENEEDGKMLLDFLVNN